MKLKSKLHDKTRRMINFTKPICISQLSYDIFVDKKAFHRKMGQVFKGWMYYTECKNVKHLGLLLAKNAYCKLNNKLWWVAQWDKIIP